MTFCLFSKIMNDFLNQKTLTKNAHFFGYKEKVTGQQSDIIVG